MSQKEHWENVYRTKEDQEVGWYQPNPETSIRLVRTYSTSKDDSIIDVGGGNSHLIQHLLNEGYTDLSVMDISIHAINRNKIRFGSEADKINWIESNILEFNSDQDFQIWHDRAVFHFLTDNADMRSYCEIASQHIKQGGFLILGTFSETGPKMCSGLPITQYSEESFCSIFEEKFELIECFDDTHTTPSGNSQDFVWVVFKKI